jgi:hypothetical protein
MSNPEDALRVLKQKVSLLQDVARTNNFKRISQIAEQMETRLSSLNSKNVGGSIQVSYLKSDVQKLQAIVNQSTLSDGEKTGLNHRFESMKGELELLGSLNTQSRELKNHVISASLALAQWTIEIERKAGAFKNLRYQKHNQLIIFLCGVIAFIVCAWMGLCYMFRWQKNRISLAVEHEVKQVIEKGIIGDERFMVDHYTDATRDEIVRLLDSLKIKLGLGSLLHHGLPFAGCMIDSNFRVSWHNQLFLDQFYLSEEEVKSEAFNWDYIRDYLSLEEDPVYEALANKIAGIYPVKIKQDEMSQAHPYEMYVTPVSANREDRVMVFFYPLLSVKDAIQVQVESSQTVMKRFIEFWNAESLGEDELKFLEKEFEINNLQDTYDLLTSTYLRHKEDRQECFLTIRSLEEENEELSQVVARLSELSAETRDIIKNEIHVANVIRSSFIATVEQGESLSHINKSIMQQNDDLRNEAQRIQALNSELIKKFKETSEGVIALDNLKADFKKIKFDLLEAKTRLISMNVNLFAGLPPLDENQQRLATKYKDELAKLDVAVATLDKKMAVSDMLITKLQMIHERQNFEQISFNWQQKSKDDHEMREALISIQRSLSQEENNIIDNLQTMGELMKSDYARVQEAFSLSTKVAGASASENTLS